MRVLNEIETNQLLLPRLLRIGAWKEVAPIEKGATEHESFTPSRDARKLFTAATTIASWFEPTNWLLLQFDNSFSPLGAEVEIVERLIFPLGTKWKSDEQRTILVGDPASAEGALDSTTTILFVYFALLFEWHVYMIGSRFEEGQYLGLQDGLAYFFGRRENLISAASMIEKLKLSQR